MLTLLRAHIVCSCFSALFRLLGWTLLLRGLLVMDAWAQPQLIKSFTSTLTTNYGAVSQSLVDVNGTLFFPAYDIAHGYELWKSDGTSNGTVLVKDINPGSAGTSFAHLTNVNGTLYFSANDGLHGAELWKSDGTPNGTVLVKDINPGTSGSYFQYLINVNGTLYFHAYDAGHGSELWKSNGTEAGTALVKDINPGVEGSIIGFYRQASIGNVNGTFFFGADNGVDGTELWKSDGTPQGTIMVADINPGPGSSSPDQLTNVNGTLLFSADNGMQGIELWKSNGTPGGTMLVKDIRTGSIGAYPSRLTNMNGTLYYWAFDDTHGFEFWKSNGTAAGTVLVKDINPGPNSSGGSVNERLISIGGTFYFAANDGVHGEELWKSDGTPNGTVLIKDVSSGATSYVLQFLVNVNGLLYFTAVDSAIGQELWKSDGSPGGTALVKDIKSGASNSSPWNLTASNGTLFFSADDGTHGSELWKSNGTEQSTVLVKDINLQSSVPPYGLTVNGTDIFLVSKEDNNGYELWKSNGTPAGTGLVKDINPGPADSYIQSLTNVGGQLYFNADDGVHGIELWKSNGTTAGTSLVKDLIAGSAGSNINALTDWNGTLFFTADDGVHGQELWKSDGTSSGTGLVKDINPGAASTYPGNLTAGNGGLYFVANSFELWKSDGTTQGTALVKKLNLSGNGSGIHNLTYVNGLLFFIGDDGIHGQELWKSDGTPAGTVLVKDIHSGADSHYIYIIGSDNGTLFFQADDGTHGYEPWRSDGTAAGTMLLKDVNPGPNESVPRNAFKVNGTVFFTADDGVHGRELWKSDGTSAGTVLFKDIHAGACGSSVGYLASINGTAFLQADDGVHGQELWMSDGTTAGTALVADINPGLEGSLGYFSSAVTLKNTLYFTADNGTYQPQLWKYEPQPATCSATGSILREVWTNVRGANLSSIPVNTSPNLTGQLPVFRTPSSYGDNYGQRIRGYICAPTTGAYQFFMQADDQAELYLSTDANPANKQRIAKVSSTSYSWTQRPEQQSTLINLVAGRKYYVEALHKESLGGDVLRVGWLTPSMASTGSAPDFIPGSVLSPFVPSTSKITPVLTWNTPADITVGTVLSSTQLNATGDVEGTLVYSPAIGTLLPVGNNQRLSVIFTPRDTTHYNPSSKMASINVLPMPTCKASGSIFREVWTNVPGKLVSAIPLNTPASVTGQLTNFNTPAGYGNNYGQRIRGYLCAPTTGSYTFFVQGDDQAELYFSSDDSPANKVKIVSVLGALNWTAQPTPVTLIAGHRYYVEALHKENLGGDVLRVGWKTPLMAADATPVIIPGSVLSPFVPSGGRQALAESLPPLHLEAYPNPTAGNTTVEFTTTESGWLSLQLYNLQGQELQQLFSQSVEVNTTYQRPLDASSLPSGLYLLRLVSGKQVITHKLLVTH